jgi:(2Fe-2S) ferredoxin
MLCILLIKDLKIIHFKNIDNEDAGVIIQRHLTGDRDILECQEELITNGLKEYAKL